MRYEDEHLLIGQFGHFFTLLSFVASLVATVAYFKSAQSIVPAEEKSWKKMARTAFILEVLSVLAVFFTLYLIIYNHFFEYKYAYQHSKTTLDTQYLLSCFWEGQEGSFMLWSFWHSILGLVLIRTAGRWEAPVMAIVSLVQVFLATFLIGIYFFDVRLGTSPFVLMRNEFPEAPFASDPRYLTNFIRDGNGLNILLQNYWMVIHPPVLFLGFASTLVPFSFAVSGLWKKDYGGWVKPALPWSLFSAGVLGLGIMMGAAWAYESLTFGGYWAWDPVENASMVPWLVLVAGIHTLLIYKHTGHSLRASYFFIPLGFLLVLYSTFLTRTGVLGDTSVHSFTGEGNSLYWHLIVMMLTFGGILLVLYLRNRKAIPVVHKEESMNAREFWMFVGSLLFFIAALYVIVFTSLPFINKLIGTQWAIGQEVEYVYNRVMVLVAFVIGILTAITQYLKYKDTGKKYFLSKIGIPLGITLVISVLLSLFGQIHYDRFGPGFLVAIHMALWAAVFSVIANGAYIWSVLKGNMKAAGASIAHVGFGMMLAGILISSSKKELISFNRTGMAVTGLKDAKGRDENPLENITLIHNVPVPMGRYLVTYEGDSTGHNKEKVYFKINFRQVDSLSGQVRREFNLYPNAFLIKSPQGTQLSSNPGSKHYLTSDIFVYITSWLNPDNIRDTSTFRNYRVGRGDTIFYSNGYMIVDEIIAANKNDNKGLPLVDSAWLTDISVTAKDGRRYKTQPAYFVKDGVGSVKADSVIAQNLVFRINGTAGNKIDLGVRESDSVMRYITLKAYRFPYINLLWLGTLVMVTGFGVSLIRRIKLARQTDRA